jgi:hypothetical protein
MDKDVEGNSGFELEFQAVEPSISPETGMRMREMFTPTPQANFAQRTIFLNKTKNGDKRQVPLSTVAVRKTRVLGARNARPARHGGVQLRWRSPVAGMEVKPPWPRPLPVFRGSRSDF